jgi:hypothetical protein
MFIFSKLLDFFRKFSFHSSSYASLKYEQLNENREKLNNNMQDTLAYLTDVFYDFQYHFSFLPKNLRGQAPKATISFWGRVLWFPILGVLVGIQQFLKAFLYYSQSNFLKTLAFVCNPFLESTSFKDDAEKHSIASLFFGILGYPTGLITGVFINANVLLISNLYALSASFYVHVLKGIAQPSEELALFDSKIHRPKSYLGYYAGAAPGLMFGVVLSNLGEICKSIPLLWNRVYFDSPHVQFQIEANHAWWNFPGKMSAYVLQMMLFVPVFSIRLIIDTAQGIVQGVWNSYQRLKVFIGDLGVDDYQPMEAYAFHQLGQYAGMILGIPFSMVKLLMWDGFILSGLENFKQACQLSYHYAFWDQLEDERIILIDKDLTKWQKFKKIVLGSMGGALGFVAATVIWPSVSLLRVIVQISKGLQHGFFQGRSQVLVSGPFEFLNKDLLTDESDYQKQWMIFGTIFSLVPGVFMGGMERIIKEFGVGVKQGSARLVNVVLQDLSEDYHLSTYQASYFTIPGQVLGSVLGIPMSVSIITYRLLTNHLKSFLFQLFHAIDQVLSEEHQLNMAFSQNENERVKWGFLGNALGLIVGRIAYSIALFFKHLPPFLWKHFSIAFHRLNLFGVHNEYSISNKFDYLLGPVIWPLGFSIGLVFGFAYNSWHSYLYVLKNIFNLIWVDHPERQVNIKKWESNLQQKIVGSIGGFLGGLIGSVSLVIVGAGRLVYENLRSVLLATLDGLKFIHAKVHLKPSVELSIKSRTTLEKMMAISYWPMFLLSCGVASLFEAIRALITHTSMGIWEMMKMGGSLSYRDREDFYTPQFLWKRSLGFMISALTVFPVQMITTFCFRFLEQTMLSSLNAIVQGFRIARQIMSIRQDKNQERTSLDPVFTQNKTEKILGVIGQIFILPSMIIFTAYSFVINMVFQATAELMLYVTELFVKRALIDMNIITPTFPPIGKRYFLGLIGVAAGISLGLTLWTLITACRLIKESIYGISQAVRGHELNEESRSDLKNILAMPGYAVGFILRNTLRVPYLMMCEAKRYVYLDSGAPSEFLMTNIEFFAGGFGFIFALPIAVFTFIGHFCYRIIDESIQTLKGSIQSALNLNLYHDQSRTTVAQYAFGGIGLIIPYTILFSMASLVMTLYVPIASIVKWVQIYNKPRFNDALDESPFLNHLKGLYQQLNNFNREFSQEIKPIEPNATGGKGSYCFIGKILNFNEPSIAEQYLDKVLDAHLNHPEEPVDFKDIQQQLRGSLFNQEQESQLQHTHEYVEQTLNQVSF